MQISNRRQFAIAWLATLLFFAAFYALLIPLPLYLNQSGLLDWQIGAILSGFGVASPLGRPLAGLATDQIGARRMMLGGACMFLLGFVLQWWGLMWLYLVAALIAGVGCLLAQRLPADEGPRTKDEGNRRHLPSTILRP